MLSREEKDFIAYWEQNRLRQKNLFRSWLVGLPAGLLIAVPIILNYATGWYKRAAMVAGSQFNPLVLVIALLLIVTFSAIFYKQHEWERHEQKYRELKARSDE